MISSNIITTIAAGLVGLGSASVHSGKPHSYRYGELASWEASMNESRRMPDVWTPALKAAQMHKRSEMLGAINRIPMSYKYGRKACSKHGKPQNMVMATSYKYGRKFNHNKKMNMRQEKPALARGQPASYRYGQKFMHMPNANRGVRFTVQRKPFTGSKAITSYRYGQKFMNKQKMSKNASWNQSFFRPVLVADILALRDMPVKSAEKNEENIIMKPWGMKPKFSRNIESRIELFQDMKGNLRTSQKQVDVMNIEIAPGISQRVVNMKSFNGEDSFVQGNFMFIGKSENLNDMANMQMSANEMPKSTLKAASIKDNFENIKEKIDLENEWVRAGVSIVLGLAATLFMVLIGKILFGLWVKLGRRNDDENRLLLKGELESIHPISIVYKN